MQASCQCGLVHFETPASSPTEIYVCHCTECQHQSASAFGISALFSRKSFERAVRPVMDMMIKDGDVKVYERPTLKGRTLQCLFCSRCGCRIVHMGKGEEEKDGATISVKGGCLKGLTKDMLKDAIHIWTTTAIVEISEGAQQFEDDGDMAPRDKGPVEPK